MSGALQQFRDALIERSIVPPPELLADGNIHRCDAEGRGGKGDAAYLLHLDGIPAGGFENWRDGLGWQNWRADVGRPVTYAEEAANRVKVEAAKQQREAEDTRRKAEARERACLIWAEANPCTGHPYLARKGISAHGARTYGGRLVLPIRDTAGTIHSLQFIGADGAKRYLTGGRIRGCYFGIGKPDGVMCIAEGYATGASIYEATGYAVAVAFDAGNLKAAALALRERFPGLRLILCADDDYLTEGNPGITKATEAARAVGGVMVAPSFGDKRPEGATDFNDMATLLGLDEVRRAIEVVGEPPREDQPPPTDSSQAAEYARDVSLIRACDLTPEAISWIWNGWLAAGKMHVLGGAPGTGKTTISMGLAATVTTGGRWPDGNRSIAGNVVIWSGEDDPADTLIPRLMASGADLTRVYFISGVREGCEHSPFDPARDMEPLQRKLIEIGDVRLLIVDPIVSAVSGDSHKNSEVRRGLQPLVDLAASMHCALLGITHFSKGTGGRDPVERLTGSLAFGALARVVLVAAKHQEEGEDGRTVRLFCRAKSNIGPDDGGFEYDLHQGELKTHPGVFASSVLWGESVEGAARELLATADATGSDGEGGTLAGAKQFLTSLLASGPLPSKAIKSDADGAGYSWTTIRRAQKALGIEPTKEGGHFGTGKQQWLWRLPAEPAHSEQVQGGRQKMLKKIEDAQQKVVSVFSENEHVQQMPGTVEVEV